MNDKLRIIVSESWLRCVREAIYEPAATFGAMYNAAPILQFAGEAKHLHLFAPTAIRPQYYTSCRYTLTELQSSIVRPHNRIDI